MYIKMEHTTHNISPLKFMFFFAIFNYNFLILGVVDTKESNTCLTSKTTIYLIHH